MKQKYSLFHFDNILSTNTYLKNSLTIYKPYSVILSDNQEGGRGRFERSWISAKGKDLTFSLLLPLKKDSIKTWQNITQISSLAIVEEISNLGYNAKIKWPNDILLENKKLCGILCIFIFNHFVCSR